MDTNVFEVMEQYREKGFSVIPVNGKMPLIKNWSEFCNKLPPMEKLKEWEKFTDPTGIGLCLGPASNICCIDCDTDDPEVIKLLQYSPVEKRGKKGFTRFYRINFGDEINKWIPPQQIITIGKVEFFFGGKQTVIIGKHPDGPEFNYRWVTNQTLLNIDLDALPVFDPSNIEAVKNFYDPRNMPKSIKENPEEDGHRYNDMMSFTSSLIRKETSLDDAVDQLLAHDQERNYMNPFFLDASKGHKTLHVRINAAKFYGDMLASLNSKKTSIDQIEAPKSLATESYKGEWGEIEEFKLKEPIFDRALIPTSWMDWIVKNATNTGISEASILFQALAGLSSLIGNKVSIRPKKDEYTQPANIWVTCIAEPGSRKSAVSDIALYPLRQVEKHIQKESKEKNKSFSSHKDSIMEDIHILKKKMKLMEKQGATLKEIKDVRAQISLLEKQIEKPEIPLFPIINNMTPERLMQVAESNRTGGLVLHLEGTGLFESLGKKGWEFLKPFLLVSWDGNTTYTYQTKSQGQVYIESLNLSLVMAIQPTVYQKYVTKVIADLDDGFAQRSFLVYDTRKDYDLVDEELDPSLREEITKIFFQAHNLNPGLKCKFSPEAYKRYLTYEKELKELIKSENGSQLVTFWAKYSGLVIRLAYLYEFIKSAHVPSLISLESLETAIKFTEFNTDNVRLAYNRKVFDDANLILNLFKTRIFHPGVTVNAIYKSRLVPSHLNSVEKIMLAINELERRNMAKREKTKNAIQIFINPKLLE